MSTELEVMVTYVGPRPGGDNPPMYGLQPQGEWNLCIKVDGEKIRPIEYEATSNEHGRPTITMKAKIPATIITPTLPTILPPGDPRSQASNIQKVRNPYELADVLEPDNHGEA